MHVLALSLSILAGTPPALHTGLEWAEVLEAKPDAAVVTDHFSGHSTARDVRRADRHTLAV